MKAVTIKQLKDELSHKTANELKELCLHLARFKKENKELLTYLLFESHDEEYPVIVARENGRVLAWGSISPWSDRCAYSGTGEISFYVDPDFHRKGIGFNILKRLIEIGKEKNFRTLVSRIAGKSEASVHLHKKLGFSNIGTMKNVGKKFDEIIDVHLMQILF
mgnify:CR=1 FL=1